MCTSAARLQQTNTNPINNTINMKTHINTITVTVDIDNLLKSVYAESAWLKASNMINATDGHCSPPSPAPSKHDATANTAGIRCLTHTD